MRSVVLYCFSEHHTALGTLGSYLGCPSPPRGTPCPSKFCVDLGVRKPIRTGSCPSSWSRGAGHRFSLPDVTCAPGRMQATSHQRPLPKSGSTSTCERELDKVLLPWPTRHSPTTSPAASTCAQRCLEHRTCRTQSLGATEAPTWPVPPPTGLCWGHALGLPPTPEARTYPN